MTYVYILQSLISPERYYTGMTSNLEQRIAEHNAGKSIHTNKFKPQKIKTYIAFSDEQKAEAFELYLKSGSGRAFVKKHLQLRIIPVTLAIRCSIESVPRYGYYYSLESLNYHDTTNAIV